MYDSLHVYSVVNTLFVLFEVTAVTRGLTEEQVEPRIVTFPRLQWQVGMSAVELERSGGCWSSFVSQP